MDLTSLPFSSIDLALCLGIALAVVMLFISRRRIEQLERRIEQLQITTTRELTMVSQGSIGIGRRCAALEKQMKAQASAAQFSKPGRASNEKAFAAAMQRAQEVMDSTKTVAKKSPQRHSAHTSNAEKALSEWVKANQTA